MLTDVERALAAHRLAWWMALLSFATLVLSAYIRLRAAGLGCGDWPACYGLGLSSAEPAALDAVRVAHRVVATLTLLLGARLAWCCWRPHPLRGVAGLSMGLVLVMLVLTVVGIFSADPQRVWASFINMLGGVALVALSWRMVLETRPALVAKSLHISLQRIVLLGRMLLVATIALGALIGARYAAVSCTTVPSCGGVWWPALEVWTLLNPFDRIDGPLLSGDPLAPLAPLGASLHLLHRGAAVTTLLVLGWAGIRALRTLTHRKEGAVLLSLLGIEVGLGSLTVLSGFSLWLALAHSVCAAALLAAVVQLSRGARA